MDCQNGAFMGINICFVDTVCWIALLNQQDHYHEIADSVYKKQMKSGTRFITTSSVLDETANALCDPLFKPSVITFFSHLQTSPRVEIIFVDPAFWSKGWELYDQRRDKAWSLTDCISIAVMKERGVTDALTSDRHFVQAGFRDLLTKEE
jgi:hypothetical protein